MLCSPASTGWKTKLSPKPRHQEWRRKGQRISVCRHSTSHKITNTESRKKNMYNTSAASTNYEYKAEPAVVAQACCAAFERLGKVRSVSRETGTIQGEVSTWNPFGADAELLVTISRKEGGTILSVQSSATEGIVSNGSAQKAVARLIETLNQDSRLAGKAASGW